MLLPQTLAQEFQDVNPLNESESIFFETLSLVDIFEMTENGVVSITVTKDSMTGASGVGSGFVFDKFGHIVTNNHVVENSQKIIVTFVNGVSFKATVVGTDPFTDLAVIKIDADPQILTPLSLGDSSNLRVGEQIAAIGNPFGLSGSMSSGIVSQIGRLLPADGTQYSIPDVIQTDAAINPGNSGGPLLNMRAEVVGINTAIRSNNGEFAGVGFSIPSKTIAKIVPKLIENGKYDHPWIGITSLNVDPDIAMLAKLPEARGVMVMNVIQDSPAHKAGIRGSSETSVLDGIEHRIGGDVIVGIDGVKVRQIDDILVYLQREKSVGDKIDLEILRDEQVKTITINLDKRPES